jgi:hypothetical protein
MIRTLARRPAALCLAAFLWTAGMPAWSATVQVGRASTEVPDHQRWTVRQLQGPSVGISAGVHGRSQMSVTTLWLEGAPGRVDAVLVLEGSKDSYGTALVWDASCEGHKTSRQVYVRNAWKNLWREAHDDCLIVAGPVDVGASLESGQEDVAALLKESGLQLSGAGYVVRATVSRQGTTLTVMAYLREPFRGSTQPTAVVRGLAEVPAPVVQWGAELAAAVRASTLSLSGRFTLPPIVFD